MDARHFDALTRAFSAPDTRRRLLGLLLALPLLGGLLAWLDPEAASARNRRRRRKGRQRKRRNKARGKRRRAQRQRACTPKKRAVVCAGQCGVVQNRQTCGKRVDCGPCPCDPPCAACFTCQIGADTPGTCVPDPAQVGDRCGSPGQVCQADGACACTDTSCPACEECGAEGVCTGCSGCCEGETCVESCPPCTICDDKQCIPCPGCCDLAGVCQPGNANDACGLGGGACDICTKPETCGGGNTAGVCGCTPTTCEDEGKDCDQIADGCGGTLDCGTCGGATPICIDNVCTACSSHDQCGPGKLCVDDACLACDVTCEAQDNTCDGAALQTMLNSGGTVVVCPGFYTGEIVVQNPEPVTMVGAGQGSDPATNTILRNFRVSNVTAFAARHLRLQGFARTTDQCEVNGIRIENSSATLTDCTIADIGHKFCTNWSTFTASTVEMVNCLVTGAYRYSYGGLEVSGGKLTLRASTITENLTLDAGGGLSVVDGAVVKLKDGTVVSANDASWAGGIYIAGGAEVKLQSGSTVTGNFASGHGHGGGGVYVDEDTESTPPIPGKLTIDETASVTGNHAVVSPDLNNCDGPGTIIGTCGS